MHVQPTAPEDSVKALYDKMHDAYQRVRAEVQRHGRRVRIYVNRQTWELLRDEAARQVQAEIERYARYGMTLQMHHDHLTTLRLSEPAEGDRVFGTPLVCDPAIGDERFEVRPDSKERDSWDLFNADPTCTHVVEMQYSGYGCLRCGGYYCA